MRHHQLDLLLSPGTGRYWINPTPPGAMAEHLLRQAVPVQLVRETLSGRAIRYGDWLLPGVIGMNLMFWPVRGGLRHRPLPQERVLKRLRATPASAAEFLCAQLLSRILITLVVSLLVFLVAYGLLGVPLLGSGWLLLLIALLGGASMASLGLLVAARIQNEELASGLLNVISMPMMFLSGVWFSLEGAPPGCSSWRPGCRSARSSRRPVPSCWKGQAGPRWRRRWAGSCCLRSAASPWAVPCSNGVTDEVTTAG